MTVHDALLCMEPFIHTAMMVDMLPIVERRYWLDKFPSFCNNHKKGKPDAGGKLASQDTGGLDQLEYRFLSERISLSSIEDVHKFQQCQIMDRCWGKRQQRGSCHSSLKYRINTCDKDESGYFNFPKFYTIAIAYHPGVHNFACMEPTTANGSCI